MNLSSFKRTSPVSGNRQAVVLLLILATLINLAWGITFRMKAGDFSQEIDTMHQKVREQERIIRQQELALEKYQEKNVLNVTVTAYTPRESETDSTPEFTAIMSRSRPGYTAAVSRDLLRYLGRRIYIEGVGVYGLEDVMNPRFKKRIDLMFGDVRKARAFGKRKMTVIVLNQFDDAFTPAVKSASTESAPTLAG